jgi:hypothetical protein
MLNPLRSEEEAFKALLWFALFMAILTGLVLAGRAIF